MIVDFVGDSINGSIFTSAQHLYELSQDCSFELACVQIVLELKTSKVTHRDSLWMLSTNLIDRNPTNQNRSLSYFALQPNRKRFILDFPSLAFHPLERIHTQPTFEFKNLFGNAALEISHVIVRTEIRKKCLDSANRLKI